MTAANPADIDQAALWNGHAGRAWVDAQATLDRMFRPIEDQLMAAVREASPQRVLDVGCGAGSTTLAAARLLGAGGRCTGLDISQPLIDAARSQARSAGLPVDFVCADAQSHAFEPAAFDLLVSRFGVMFFADPVRAFANLHRAARAGARLEMAVWRSAAENPFMTTAERAAAPLLDLPVRRPGGPGQFAFGDAQHVRAILQAGGWSDVDIRPVDADCGFAAQELPAYFTRLGPLGLALQQADAPTRERVVQAVHAAFEPYVQGAQVRYTAACWMVRARA